MFSLPMPQMLLLHKIQLLCLTLKTCINKNLKQGYCWGVTPSTLSSSGSLCQGRRATWGKRPFMVIKDSHPSQPGEVFWLWLSLSPHLTELQGMTSCKPMRRQIIIRGGNDLVGFRNLGFCWITTAHWMWGSCVSEIIVIFSVHNYLC